MRYGEPTALLRAAGCSEGELVVARAEVVAMYDTLDVLGGALEVDDLWSAAVVALWEAHQRHAHLGGGYIRRCVWGAVHDALRAERRAQGHAPRTIRWPVYWPREGDRHCHAVRPTRLPRRCKDCGEVVEGANQMRCGLCQRQRRRAQQRAYNAAYWRRRHPVEVAA